MCAGGPPKPVRPIHVHSRATVASGTRSVDGCAPATLDTLSARRREEFDRIARRILEQYLVAARPGHDLVAV
jgi:hypothetical protein